MSPGEDELRRLITLHLAGMCGMPPAEVDPDRPLEEHGLSSKDAVALAGYLETVLGRPLPPTLVWEHPTVSQLASVLAHPETQTQPASPRPAVDGPIAVVGIGCRFPGAGHGPGAFWDFLRGAGDGVTEVPAERWAAFDDGSPAAGAALAAVTRQAGVLADIAGFDAEFFGIPPAEAALMDPQQRILLEVCWEALEHAGIPPRSLRGSRAGVFAGIGAAEYAHLTTADLGRIDAWTATGAAASVAAGRISYLLDLRGPSLAVDTACSSSLLAVHLAVGSLRSGECDLALAGGVNLLLSPVITMTFDAAGGTSPDGRCRPFDAAANGMVRGEGCGVIVLKRLADAAHDRVLAVITSTAVNSDGRSNGLVAPNAAAQRDLLRAAHRDPGQVDYVEAHGTGTPLGDPIEASALGEVLGRPGDRPLLIGSVKSNIGHLEAAAGIAGLIKTVLAVSNRQIPATLHFTAPSPHVAPPGLGLAVVSQLTPWPDNPWPPTAGVSAFGFSGTNVHVVLTTVDPPAVTGGTRRPVEHGEELSAFCPMHFSLTDVTTDRIAGQARVLAEWVAQSTAPLEQVAGTLAERQGRGPHRSIVLASDRAQLSAALAALGAGQAHPSVVSGLDAQPGPGVAFVFSGYGSQWAGMGQALAAAEPVFAGALAELEEPVRAAAGFSLRQAIGDAAALRDVQRAQPALFAIQVALAQLWEAHGVRPVAVIGHSMGEVAAAVVSGALSVADGARVIATRSRLLSRLAGAGAMALIGLPAAEVTELAADLPELYLAVISSPVQCVVTGDAGQVAELARRVTAGGGTARVLQAEGAGHSPQVDPLLGELTGQLTGLAAGPPRLRFYATAQDPGTPPACDPAYWAANVRQPVRLGPAVAAAAADGLRALVEVSPHPMLARALTETVRHETGGPGVITGTLRRDAPTGFHTQLAKLAAGGVRLPRPRTIIDLPPAPWRHETYWADPPPAAVPGHPLLGPHTELPGEHRHAWQRTADDGAAVFPLSAAGEMALAAACEAWGIAATSVAVTGLRLERLLPVSAGTVLSTMLDEQQGGPGTVRIHLQDPPGPWLLAATATVTGTPLDAGPLPPGTAHAVPAASGHARGQHIPAETLAGCLALATTGPDQVPVSADLLQVRGPAALGGFCTVRSEPTRPAADADVVADLALAAAGAAAQPLLDLRGVCLRTVPPAAIPVPYPDKIFELTWPPEELPPGEDGPPRRWVVLGGEAAPLAQELAACLRAAGHQADLAGAAMAGEEAAGVVLVAPPGPLDPAAAQRLALEVVRLAAALAGQPRPPRLWIVTACAAAVRPGEAGEPGLAALRGVVRVLALERPALRTTLADLGPGEQVAALAAELIADPADDEVAWREGVRLVARLARAQPPEPRPHGPVVRSGGGYIITGGYGGLGLLVARWLAGRGAGRIVLSGRSGPPPATRAVLDELGAEVVLGDVAEPGVAERLVAAAQDGGTPLRGVVHAAGVFADALVDDVTEEGLATVWGPKVTGAWRLHQATAGADLDWFVLYSSAAALLGSPGQAVYAAANAWLDAFAGWRRARGLPAVAVNWGVWAGPAAGVVLGGIDPIGPGEGVAALETLLAEERANVGVIRIDPAAAAAAYPEIAAMPYFAALVGAAGDAAWAGPDALRAADPAQRRALAGQRAADQVAAVLGVPVSPALPLADAGMDSLAAQRICNLLEHDLGVTLEPAALLGGTTLAQLQESLAVALGVARGAGPAAAPRIVAPGEVEPRDAAERLLARVVAEVLAIRPPGVTDDLRAAGLTVVAKREIAARVSMETGTQHDAGTLFAVPTVEAAAEAVRQADETEAASLVRPITAGGPNPPVLLAHPAGGTTGVYKALAGLLDGSRPVFGLERLEGPVPARAARYAQLILDRFPGGGWVLGGWSFGGVLAYEVARQLSEAGHQAGLVVLLDAALPLPVVGGEDEALAHRFAAFADYLERTYGRQVRLPASDLLGLAEDAQFDLLTQRMTAAGLTDVLSPAILRHQRQSHEDTRALERYEPGKYDGPVLLYRTEQDTPWAVSDPRYQITSEGRGWDLLCPGLTVVPVDAHHLNLLDPPAVHTVAAHLRTLLASQGGPT